MNNLEQNMTKPNQNAVKLLNEQITKELIENSTKPKANQSFCCSN
jgi:hypothetical protein